MSDGNVDVVKDRLTSFVITGARSSIMSFRSHVGRGSRLQDLGGHFIINLVTSSIDTSLKDCKCALLDLSFKGRTVC
jgi:hypothetical protein